MGTHTVIDSVVGALTIVAEDGQIRCLCYRRPRPKEKAARSRTGGQRGCPLLEAQPVCRSVTSANESLASSEAGFRWVLLPGD